MHLRHVFDGADATLETVQNFEFKGQVPAIMFDMDNSLAYTGKGHSGVPEEKRLAKCLGSSR